MKKETGSVAVAMKLKELNSGLVFCGSVLTIVSVLDNIEIKSTMHNTNLLNL